MVDYDNFVINMANEKLLRSDIEPPCMKLGQGYKVVRNNDNTFTFNPLMTEGLEPYTGLPELKSRDMFLIPEKDLVSFLNKYNFIVPVEGAANEGGATTSLYGFATQNKDCLLSNVSNMIFNTDSGKICVLDVDLMDPTIFKPLDPSINKSRQFLVSQKSLDTILGLFNPERAARNMSNKPLTVGKTQVYSLPSSGYVPGMAKGTVKPDLSGAKTNPKGNA